MPLSPFIALYNFADNFTAAWKNALETALASQAIAVPVWVPRDRGLLDTTRIELMWATGAAMTQRTTLGQLIPKQVPNAFEGTLAVKVTTCRELEDPDFPLHGILCGLVRWTVSAQKQAINGTNLPLYQILDVIPEGDQPTVYDPKEQDETTILFHHWFAIRNDAWPQETPPGGDFSGEFSGEFDQ